MRTTGTPAPQLSFSYIYHHLYPQILRGFGKVRSLLRLATTYDISGELLSERLMPMLKHIRNPWRCFIHSHPKKERSGFEIDSSHAVVGFLLVRHRRTALRSALHGFLNCCCCLCFKYRSFAYVILSCAHAWALTMSWLNLCLLRLLPRFIQSSLAISASNDLLCCSYTRSLMFVLNCQPNSSRGAECNLE